MAEATNADLVQRQVQFRLRDIYHPDPQAVVDELYGDSVLQGRVLDITQSDDGTRFAVVKVAGLAEALLIAVNRITNIV